jgi:hypothetical protein
VSSSGSAYARFRRALSTRDLLMIRTAAAELPHIDLGDALEVCVVFRGTDPARLEAAAVRWVGRFCAERPGVTLEEVDRAVRALTVLRSAPEDALGTLQTLCR